MNKYQGKNETLQIIYTWPDSGREEVRYERYFNSEDALKLIAEVEEIKARCDLLGEVCPYSYRYV